MTDRLRVLLLVNDLRVGGAERQLVELARGLDRERFRTTVATLYPGGALEEELRGADGVELVSLDRRHKLDFGTIVTLARLLRRERIDVVQPFLTPATFFGLTAALRAGTPLKIVTERCGLRAHPGLGSTLYRFVEDRLTRYADAAVANSEAGRSYLLARGIRPEQVRVVYNGISAARTSASAHDAAAAGAQLGLPKGARVAGIVASLQPAKDHETFLRAAAEVARAHPDAHFVLVGDGELRARLGQLAHELRLSERVHFTGNVADVAPYVETFDLAVLSSCDHEGCSNALLEAMAMGKPVVATDVGGNAELVTHGENGLIVPARDIDALAAAIAALLDNPARAASMGEAGRTRFQGRFTVERMVGAYEALYTQLWQRRAQATPAGDAVPSREEAKPAK